MEKNHPKKLAASKSLTVETRGFGFYPLSLNGQSGVLLEKLRNLAFAVVDYFSLLPFY